MPDLRGRKEAIALLEKTKDAAQRRRAAAIANAGRGLMCTENGRKAHEIDSLKARIAELEAENREYRISHDAMVQQGSKQQHRTAELEAFVRDQPCECLDEYGHRKPEPCDRCKLLGLVEDESAKVVT